MSKGTEHIGSIVKVEYNKVLISIYSKSPCFACDVKRTCSLSGTSEKILEVKVSKDEEYNIGQQVKLVMKTSAGFKSAALAYLLPVILMITSIVISKSIVHNDALTGLIAIAVLIAYFFVLSYFKEKLEKSLIINIEPLSDRFILQ